MNIRSCLMAMLLLAAGKSLYAQHIVKGKYSDAGTRQPVPGASVFLQGAHKQDALAIELGDDWNQKKISLLEGKESIDAPVLEEVAKALKVPVEAIKNFDEETAIHNIQNNYDNAVINAGPTININAILIRLISILNKLKKTKNCINVY